MEVGLIGCGRVARIHMCAYANIPEAKVVAVADVNLKKAKAFAQNHGIESVFENYSELFEMKSLDYVDICTPTSTHAKITCEAAGHGHNILLEKPMARKTSECDEIIEEVSKHRVKLCICHNQLFTPAVAQAKSIVDTEGFDLTYLRVSVKENPELIGVPSWTMTPEQGGLLWETGCHSAYLQLHFLGNIKEVLAMGSKVKHSVHDQFIALLRTSNEALGIIEVSSVAKRPEIIFEFMSSDGKRMQIIDYNNFSEIPESIPQSLVKGFYLDQKAVLKKWKNITLESLRKRSLLACIHHHNLIAEYIQSIKNDSEPPVKPEDGRKTIKLLECIEESLKKSYPVRVGNLMQ